MGIVSHIRKRAAGFTLIELLAAMSVLVLIALMMARVYTDTTKMWELGTRRVTSAAEGRVVMDFLVRELATAIADDVVAFRTVSPGLNNESFIYGVETYGAEADEIYFVGLVSRGNSSNRRRTGAQFAYFVTQMVDEDENLMPHRYRLVRTRKTEAMYSNERNRDRSAYGMRNWWLEQPPILPQFPQGRHNAEVIAENVAAFEIWAYSDEAGDYVSNYRSWLEGNRLPVWVDVYLEMLSEADAIRAAALFEAGNESEGRLFVDNQARRYMSRVYFGTRDRALAFVE
jgi:prepilin-type N-terminal cleavage/methylation domain-containing protein